MIKYISHENCNEDPYIKEIVYLSIDDVFRFAYVRKLTKTGSLFWGPMSAGITIQGQKKYFDSIEWDSNFLKKDILAFLEARSWEGKNACQAALHSPQAYEIKTSPLVQSLPPLQMSFLDDCPF